MVFYIMFALCALGLGWLFIRALAVITAFLLVALWRFIVGLPHMSASGWLKLALFGVLIYVWGFK